MSHGAIAKSKRSLGLKSILRDAVADGRRCFVHLAAYDILFRIFSAAVLGPVSAWIFTALISSSGQLSVGNDQIATFLLSPAGVLAVVVWGVVGLASFFAAQAGMILIAADTIRRRKTSSAAALWHTLKRLPTLMELAARQVAVYALVTVPALGLAAAAYFSLLTGHDINFYLAQRPPVFWVALAIGAVLATLVAGVVGILYFRWILAVPICLFETEEPAAAMRASRQATRGFLPAIAGLLLGWTLVAVALGSAGVVLVDQVGHLLFGMIGERLALVIATVAGLLTLGAAVALAASFLGFTGSCLLVTRLYFALRAPRAFATAQPAAQDLEPAPDRAPRWILSRPILWTVAALLALGTILMCYAVVEHMNLKDQVAVTAHRGASRAAPENSLAAIRKAADAAADFAEIDVQETADGAVVVLHDADLMRVAGLNRNIWDVTYAEIADLDAGSWFAPDFKDERIPTLAQAIQAADDRIKLNIELKFNGHDQDLVRRVLDVVRQQNFQARCVITSLTLEGALEARQLDPQMPVGYIVFRALGDVTRLDVDFFSISADAVDHSLVTSIHEAGKQLHVWTVNDPRQMSAMIDLGVDNIITDEPELLVKTLQERAELGDVERLLLKFRNRLWQ